MAKEIQTFKFPAGVNNIDPEDSLPEGSARKLVNADLSGGGSPRRREGYTKLMDLTNASSLFSNENITLIVNNGWLSRYINKSLIPITEVGGELSYADIDGIIYFSDGINLGRIIEDGSYRPAWVKNPTGMPTLSSDPDGSLPSGLYQVALTNIDESGLESGCYEGITIEVDGGGIRVSDIPQNIDASFVRIYMTVANGTEFYRQVDVPMGEVSGVLTRHHLGKSLNTQFASEMLSGTILAHHYGRLYAATGNSLVFSESLRPGLSCIMDNYFPAFDGDIQLVMPHSTGMFVIANKTYFLPGSDPDKMTIREVSPLSGVPGTGIEIAASLLGLEQTGTLPCWFTENGLVVGGADGHIMPLTEGKIGVNKYEKGAALFREEDGIRTITTALQNSGEQSNIGVSDSISFEVRRNGVIIPPP